MSVQIIGHFWSPSENRPFPAIAKITPFVDSITSISSLSPAPAPSSVTQAEVVLIMRSNFRRTEQRRKSGGGGENRFEVNSRVPSEANDNEVEIPARNHVFIFQGNYSEGKNKEGERIALGDQFLQHGTEASSAREREREREREAGSIDAQDSKLQ